MPSAQVPMPINLPTGGIIKNQPPVNIGFQGLVDAVNWIYRDGSFKVRPGLTQLATTDTDERPMGFLQYDDPSEANRLLMGTSGPSGGSGGWFRYNSGANTWDDITEVGNELTTGATAQVIFRTFQKSSGGNIYVLGCNGADIPKKWHSSENSGKYDDIVDVPAAVQDANSMVVSGNRLLLSSGQEIFASDDLDFDSWSDGYYVTLADTPGNIIAMNEFGIDSFAVYKDNSIYMGYSQVDLTKLYRFELIRSGISGPVSPASVVTLGEMGVHAYLAESGDVMMFDGTTVRSMGEHIRTHIRDTRDFDLRKRSFGLFDPLQNEIFFFYASKGSADVDMAAVVSIDTKTVHALKFTNNTISAGIAAVVSSAVSVGDLGVIDEISMTFDEMDRGVNGLVFGDAGGKTFIHAGFTDDGSAIPSWFETGMQTGPDPKRFNLLHEVEHFFPTSASTSQNVSIYLGGSDYGENIEYTTAQVVDVGAGGPYLTQHRLPGRMYSIKMQTNSSAGVEWYGSAATVTPTGLR